MSAQIKIAVLDFVACLAEINDGVAEQIIEVTVTGDFSSRKTNSFICLPLAVDPEVPLIYSVSIFSEFVFSSVFEHF